MIPYIVDFSEESLKDVYLFMNWIRSKALDLQKEPWYTDLAREMLSFDYVGSVMGTNYRKTMVWDDHYNDPLKQVIFRSKEDADVFITLMRKYLPNMRAKVHY